MLPDLPQIRVYRCFGSYTAPGSSRGPYRTWYSPDVIAHTARMFARRWS